MSEKNWNDAFEEFELISDKKGELILFALDNVNKDTDNEVGNYAELTEICLNSIWEVCGTVELSTSKKTTRTAKKKLQNNVKTKVAKEKKRT